ncbi:MAG: hypothetical protein IPF42_19605 [Candidatus Microthrix sp.]|nr:hypothetical protein [Candidatus Microthrix sp.]
MATVPGSVQRSFRLSRSTSSLLDQVAKSTNESRNALADRLLGQALRTERHPLIRFRTGAAGRNEPYLVGTRLKVRQVMETVRGHDADIDQTASSLGIASATVRAAVAYHAEFTGEVEADAAWAARWKPTSGIAGRRRQAAIARLALDHHYPVVDRSDASRSRPRRCDGSPVRGWHAEEDGALLEVLRG